MAQLKNTLIVVLLFGSVYPRYIHAASTLQKDSGVVEASPKVSKKGFAVSSVQLRNPYDHFKRIASKKDASFFNPEKNIVRNLLSFSSLSSNLLHGMKLVSEFNGYVDKKPMDIIGTEKPSSIDYEDYYEDSLEEDETPVYLPFIGARVLTNVPDFFSHLKDNLVVLSRNPDMDERNWKSINNNDIDSTYEEVNDDDTDSAAEEIDNEIGTGINWTLNEKMKPKVKPGPIYYHSAKEYFKGHQRNFLHNFLRRANNKNPPWLYTIGLGKRSVGI